MDGKIKTKIGGKKMELTQTPEKGMLNLQEQNISQGIEKKQENFLETTLGKVINKAVDIGISAVVPDLIEDEVIDIKNAILKNGFEDGIQTAISSAVNLGKSIVGMVTGKFEDVSQAQNVIKSGGVLDNVSSLLDFALNKAKSGGLLDKNMYQVVKQGKNTILNQVEKGITKEFGKQTENIEKLGIYMNSWRQNYKEQNFNGMEKQYQKIQEKLKELLPLEKTLSEARKIENLHEMIRNNEQKFNLTMEQEKLAEILV